MMELATNAPKRPALRYHGSQWNNAPWIVAHWPYHETRVIPFMGGLNEELRAPRARLTNAADLDGRVVNFFQVLRDQPNELIAAIKLTPWHEGEYQLSQNRIDDPLEDARRFWCACWMSVSGGPNPGKSGFRWTRDRDGRWSTPATDSMNIEHLYIVADRLRHIHFLQRDGLELIEAHLETPNALIWCDPPFMKPTRRSSAGTYNHETSLKLHRDTAALLKTAEGYAVITGYAIDADGHRNTVYEALYESEGWKRIDKECRVNGGGTRVQSLWVSPRTWDALQEERYPLLTRRFNDGNTSTITTPKT